MPKPIKERAGILQVLAPDGANTMPVSYMTLDDNGIELYYAGLYIDKLPVEGRFAHSFAGIFNMDYVESTVIIDPLLDQICTINNVTPDKTQMHKLNIIRKSTILQSSV